MKKVLVLDFGGQYNLLVARRVRECGVYCEIKSFRMTMDEVRSFAPDAIIFTGGPATVFDPGAPMIDPEMLSMGVPVLGICYGLQLMMHLLGGPRGIIRQCEFFVYSNRDREALEFGVEYDHVILASRKRAQSQNAFARCGQCDPLTPAGTHQISRGKIDGHRLTP